MPEPLPLITFACLCEKVLTENDGVISLIRVVDRFTMHTEPTATAVAISQLMLVIGIKWRGHTGHHVVSADIQGPTRRAPILQIPVDVLPNGQSGMNVMVTLTLQFEKVGIGRIEILFDDQLLTTVPFEVIVAAAAAHTQSPSTSGRAE